MPDKSVPTRFYYLSFFFVLVLFFLIPDGKGNSSWTSSVPRKSSPGHAHRDLHWPANYVSDANGPSPASICSNTCWSANNNTRWPAHSVFLCPSWPSPATVRKLGLYLDYFMMVAVFGDPISFFEYRTLVFYLKDHPLNIRFRIFNLEYSMGSYLQTQTIILQV